MRRRVVAALLTAVLVLGSSMSVCAVGETESTLEKVSGNVADVEEKLSDTDNKEEGEEAADIETLDETAAVAAEPFS